jgi:hypothetical protein
MCDPASLCVPVQISSQLEKEPKRLSEYAVLRVHLGEQRESLLESPAPSGYNNGAFDPAFFSLTEEEMLELLISSSKNPHNSALSENIKTSSSVTLSSYSLDSDVRHLVQAIETRQAVYVDGYGWIPPESIPLESNARSKTSKNDGLRGLLFYDCQCKSYDPLDEIDKNKHSSSKLTPKYGTTSGAWNIINQITSRRDASSKADEEVTSTFSDAVDWQQAAVEKSTAHTDYSKVEEGFLLHNGQYYHTYPVQGVKTKSYHLGYGVDNSYYAPDYLLDHVIGNIKYTDEYYKNSGWALLGWLVIILLAVLFVFVFCFVNAPSKSPPEKTIKNDHLKQKNALVYGGTNQHTKRANYFVKPEQWE